MGPYQPQLFAIGLVGLLFGVGLLARGLVAYRRGALVSSIATSHASSLAAGEVRLSGTVEALASTLVSALQSAPSVWYHSRVVERDDTDKVLLDEQRAVDFLLRDDTGTVRVVPRGARYQVAPAFDASSDLFGGEPIGLDHRFGAASMAVAEYDREAAIADLLTVRPPAHDFAEEHGTVLPAGLRGLGGAPRRHYTESRLEPGERVTIVGFARPYAEIDPLGTAGGMAGGVDPMAFDDPAMAAELAEARESGTLAATAREAWGNAAIPGFGIGRPVETPKLDTGADPELVPPDPAQVARARRIFEVPPESLVVSSGDVRPLTIYQGSPAEANGFDRSTFYRGLAGGGIAAVCAVLLAVTVNGGL